MIYRFLKKTHVITMFVSLMCFVLASNTSDFAKELGQTNPESVDALIMSGFLLLIPTMIYGILNAYLERKKHN